MGAQVLDASWIEEIIIPTPDRHRGIDPPKPAKAARAVEIIC